MQEIKFRFWSEKAKAIIPWEVALKECDRLSLFTLEGFTPMQFIGMYDTNRTEIYSGDIVMYENDYPGNLAEPSPSESNNDFAIVRWHEEARWSLNAHFQDNREQSTDWIHEYDGALTIIGNIYESPEFMVKWMG
jgi:uncharacterized phage protein (TIGR01671 family)